MPDTSGYPFWKRNLYVVTFAMIVVQMGFAFVFPFMPLFLQQIGIPDQQQAAFWTGVFTTIGATTMALLSPMWGILADRHGRKPLLLRAMFGGSIAVALLSLAANSMHVLVLRVLHGAMSGVLAPAMALVAASAPRSQIGYAMGMTQMGISIGQAFGPALGGLSADAIGFRPTFALAGGMLGISGLIVFLIVVEKFQRPEPTALTAPTSPWRGLWQSMTSRQMAPALIAVFFTNMATSVAFPVLSVFISSIDHSDQVASISGLAFSITGTLGAVSAIVSGKLSQRVGLKPILVGTCLLGGLVVIPQALVRTIPELLVLMAVQGLCNGGMITAASAMVGRNTARERQGTAFGAAGAATSLAYAVGPLSGGSIAAVAGLPAVFIFAGLVYLVMGVGALKILDASSEPKEPQVGGEVPEA
ncbi:MAG: MFS transporter [Chloroflexota bacterium]|nr:MAG: MFS transporter [Chloroflexota bacterium]